MQSQGLNNRAHVTTFVVALIIVIGDGISKQWARRTLGSESRHVVGPLWLRLHFNAGVSFSLGVGSALVTTLLTGLLSVVVIAVAWRSRAGIAAVAFGLIAGGGLGNFLNRLTSPGHVVTDFVSVGWFPIFNVADASLTLGVVILVILVLAHEQVFTS